MVPFYYIYFCQTGVHLGGLKIKGRQINYFNSIVFLGKRSNLMIIDLKHTLYTFRVTIYFLIKLISLRGRILGIESRDFLRSCLCFFLTKSRQSFYHRKWIGGLFTNFRAFKYFLLCSKYRNSWTDNLTPNKNHLFGMARIRRLPSLILFIDIEENKSAFREASRLSIPTISFYDLFVNKIGLTFAIPGNIDNIRSIFFYYKIFYNSIIVGRKQEVYIYFRKSLFLIKRNRKKLLNIFSKYKFVSLDLITLNKIIFPLIYKKRLRQIGLRTPKLIKKFNFKLNLKISKKTFKINKLNYHRFLVYFHYNRFIKNKVNYYIKKFSNKKYYKNLNKKFLSFKYKIGYFFRKRLIMRKWWRKKVIFRFIKKIVRITKIIRKSRQSKKLQTFIRGVVSKRIRLKKRFLKNCKKLSLLVRKIK